MKKIDAHRLSKVLSPQRLDEDYYHSFTSYPTEIYVEDRATHTWWLDETGEPYEIYYDPVGFDLSPK